MLKNIVAFLVVVLLAATAAAAQVYLLQKPNSVVKPQAPPITQNDVPPTDSGRPLRLAPIIANLFLPEGMWVRIDAVLIVPEKSRKDVDSVSVKIAQDFLAYLQTLSVSDLEGVHSLTFLRQELIERAQIRTENKVKDVLVTTMVLQ